jgi:hypothetical protein
MTFAGYFTPDEIRMPFLARVLHPFTGRRTNVVDDRIVIQPSATGEFTVSLAPDADAWLKSRRFLDHNPRVTVGKQRFYPLSDMLPCFAEPLIAPRTFSTPHAALRAGRRAFRRGAEPLPVLTLA